MESVDPALIQVFALNHFRDSQAEGLYGTYAQRLRSGLPILKRGSNIVEDINRFAYGIVLERRGLLQIGKDVGYLPRHADNDEIDLDPRLIAEYSKGSNGWPPWFGQRGIPASAEIPSRNPSGLKPRFLIASKCEADYGARTCCPRNYLLMRKLLCRKILRPAQKYFLP